MPGGIDLCVSFFSKKSGNRLFVVTDDGKSLPHRGVIRLKLLKDNYIMTPHFFILSPIASYCADDSAGISPSTCANDSTVINHLPVQMIPLTSAPTYPPP